MGLYTMYVYMHICVYICMSLSSINHLKMLHDRLVGIMVIISVVEDVLMFQIFYCSNH